MAEEFLQGGVCGGSWWNSPRNLFSSSPCSLASNDVGNFGWASQELIMEMKSSTVQSSDDSASDGSNSAVVQDARNPDHQPPHADGIGLPSSTTHHHWNQDLVRDSGRSEENYSNFLLDSSMNYRPQINKDWDSDSKSFIQDSSIDTLKQSLNSISSSAECVTTCPELYPLSSDSYGYASSLLQSLFDTDAQPQHSLLDNPATMNYSSSAYQQQVNSNGFLPSLPKPSPLLRQHPTLWNSTAAALNNDPSTFLPSPQSHFIPSSLTSNHKPDINHCIRAKHEEGKELGTVVKKASHEPAFKRPRIETPSPLPTFKVRKEKLGDRITALQQLVSPFGKTDTASVLHEAIEYIKFLHDQVNALSTPYLKYGSPSVQQRQQGAVDKPTDQQALTKDLQTRGLCLVPISSTFPVASETATDFWTPTFGGSFR